MAILEYWYDHCNLSADQLGLPAGAGISSDGAIRSSFSRFNAIAVGYAGSLVYQLFDCYFHFRGNSTLLIWATGIHSRHWRWKEKQFITGWYPRRCRRICDNWGFFWSGEGIGEYKMRSPLNFMFEERSLDVSGKYVVQRYRILKLPYTLQID